MHPSARFDLELMLTGGNQPAGSTMEWRVSRLCVLFSKLLSYFSSTLSLGPFPPEMIGHYGRFATFYHGNSKHIVCVLILRKCYAVLPMWVFLIIFPALRLRDHTNNLLWNIQQRTSLLVVLFLLLCSFPVRLLTTTQIFAQESPIIYSICAKLFFPLMNEWLSKSHN